VMDTHNDALHVANDGTLRGKGVATAPLHLVRGDLAEGTAAMAEGLVAGGANVANNNLLDRLIQMQAQLINPVAAQNVATA